MRPDPRDQDANNVIRAIRDERNRRRAGNIAKMFHPEPQGDRYVWDNMSNGPYAGHDRTTQMTSVDVLGLMYDLGYHATKPGGEAMVLTEADREIKSMVSSTPMSVDGPHLQMLVALVHRIITAMTEKGELQKVRTHEGQA